MSEDKNDRDAGEGDKLTARDGVVGAAHAAQLANLGSPVVRSAAQAIGVADAAKVAIDVAQGKEVRAIDIAGATASVTMSAGIGGPAVQLGAQAVSLASGLDAADRGANSLKALYDKEVATPTAADVSDRKEIEARNTDTGRAPTMTADERARADVKALHAIDDKAERHKAVAAMAQTAARDGDYGEALKRVDPLAAETVALSATKRTASAERGSPNAAALHAIEGDQPLQEGTGDRKAAEMQPRAVAERESTERLANSLDARMAKSEIEERGWKDRDDLSDVMRDLEKLAGQDWQRAADLWEKYRPGDADKPRFIDGDDAEVRRSATKADNAIERDAREVDRPIDPAKAERPQPDADDKEFVTPESIRKRFIQAENKYFYREEENRLAFEDKGKRLATSHDDPNVAKSMVELAQAKGWDAIKVKGSEEFKRIVWLQASLRGLEIDGFKPKAVDLAKLEELRQEKGQAPERAPTNVVEQAAVRQRLPKPEVSLDPSAVVDEHQRTLSGQQRQAVETLKAILRDRGDSEQAVDMAADVAAARFQNNRVHVGKILSHGQAPYENNPDNASSYYVKLQTSRGEKEVWGVDLRRAIDESSAKVGDDVALAYQGRQKVTVPVKERDAQGRVVGTSEIVVDRNTWDVNRLDKVREEVRKELTAAADRTDARKPLVKVYDRNAPREELRPEVDRVQARNKERSR